MSAWPSPCGPQRRPRACWNRPRNTPGVTKVFGKRVIDYQNNRFVLAGTKARLTMLRVFLDDCALKLMEGNLDPVIAAMAKLNATEMQGQILDELLQLYGGYGYSAEYGIGRLGRCTGSADLRWHQRNHARDYRALTLNPDSAHLQGAP